MDLQKLKILIVEKSWLTIRIEMQDWLLVPTISKCQNFELCCRTLNTQWSMRWSYEDLTYDPLPIEGMAIDLRFFSSASFRTFFTAFSKSCCELPDPPLQFGLLTWITNLAGKFCPGQIAAVNEAVVKMLCSRNDKILT